MYSIDNIDLSIILDNNKNIQRSSSGGSSAVDNLNSITNKSIPYYIGLDKNLNSDNLIGLASDEELQKTTDTILKKIEDSPNKVTIVTVGSLRDIAAAYNKNHNLLKNKVDKIYVSAGSYKGTYSEYNVSLDDYSYNTIMNSGLPIYWIPCFEDEIFSIGTNSSYFTAIHNELFDNMDSKISKWFLYRFNFYSRGLNPTSLDGISF